MIARLKPYPAMKDSGVPWLGDVPEHWDIKHIKTLFGDKRTSAASQGERSLLSLTRAGHRAQRKRRIKAWRRRTSKYWCSGLVI